MWVLAGANGSGKSTFYRLFLQPHGVRWINADDIARSLWPDNPEVHAYAASQVAADMREMSLRSGTDFATETVFSHESKLALLHDARARGYRVTLVFFHLATPELNVARVAQRVAGGGHSVPIEKILSRRMRVMTLIREALLAADEAVVLDNSDDAQPFTVLARLQRGQCVWVHNEVPPGVAGLLPE
jgi:predicted ABC-type ATPase